MLPSLPITPKTSSSTFYAYILANAQTGSPSPCTFDLFHAFANLSKCLKSSQLIPFIYALSDFKYSNCRLINSKMASRSCPFGKLSNMAAVMNLYSVIDFPYSSSIMSDRLSSYLKDSDILEMSYVLLKIFLSLFSFLLLPRLFISFRASIASLSLWTSFFTEQFMARSL